jgi:hypothetical protein
MPTIEELESSLAAANVALEEAKTGHSTTKAEAKAHRLKAERLETELTAAQAAQAAKEAEYATSKAASETVITATQAAANARIIKAELKAAAIQAGMVDLDALKMLDTSKITIDDDGEVVGADTLIAAAQKDKPYLFGATKTSSTATPPKVDTTTRVNAATMSKEEYAAAKAAELKKHR